MSTPYIMFVSVFPYRFKSTFRPRLSPR